MIPNLFTRETANIEALRELFDNAMYTTDLDSDGDLIVRDRYRVSVSIHSERFVRLLVVFGLKDEADAEDILTFVNKVNDDLICIRAAANIERRALFVDWYLPMEGGGLSPKTLVNSYRQMMGLVGELARFDVNDVME